MAFDHIPNICKFKHHKEKINMIKLKILTSTGTKQSFKCTWVSSVTNFFLKDKP